MSEKEPAVLTAAELGKLRHDLRTPFNGIIGYTEMLQESADEDGLVGLSAELHQLIGTAREVLNHINAALAPGRTVSFADLLVLAGELRQQASPLEQQAGRLLDRADTEFPSLRKDLVKLHGATAELKRLGEELLAHRKAVTAPTLHVPASSVAAAASGAASAPVNAQGGVVLVVDDNETNRDLLCRRLEREGYTPRTASGGREALALLSEAPHDLVLLDILMPDVDGYEVLRQIKASPNLRELPVIMISAVDDLSSVVRCIEMGAEDYLPKPFDPVLLHARVGACLEKKRLRDKELEYLRGVEAVQEAASAVESGAYKSDTLAGVAARTDALGQLARVFQRMADEVQAREQRLKTQVEQLRVEVDLISVDTKRTEQQVGEITGSAFFNDLQGKLGNLRAKRQARATPPTGG